MWVLDTLITILILGILSVTIAEEEIQSGNERNSTVNTKECEEYGPTGTRSLKEGWELFPDCYEFLNTTELEEECVAVYASGEGGWDALAKKYCSKIPSFTQCTGRVIDSAKACLDTESQKTVENNHNNTNAYYEFLCENDGKRVTSFLSHGGIDCAVSQNEALQACRTQLFANSTVNTRYQPLWVHLGQSECAELESFGACNAAEFRKCEDKIPADIFQSAVDFFKSRKSCPSVSPAQASPAA